MDGYKIYLKVDNITQARACANKLFHTSKSPERRVSALFLLSQIEKSAHNYKDALFYQGQAYLLSDSLQHIKGEKELKISEQKYNSLKLLNNVTTLNNKILLLASICIVVVILVVLLIFLAKRIIYTKRRELENQLYAIDELKRKCRELEDENNSIQTLQNNVISKHKECIGNTLQILDKFLEIIQNRNRDIRSGISLYIKRDKKQKSELLDAIRNITDLSAPGIINYLSTKYPELSDSDIDLYCISCQKYSKPTTCLLLNCSSVQYIYNKISILRKKLGITDSGTSLNMHLHACIQEYLAKQNE